MADVSSQQWFRVPPEVCSDFERGSRLEWLETNHTGAFAMGTVAGVNTRRYHGLLIATLNAPADRCSVFPRVEETVEHGGKTFELGTVQYAGTVSPAGYGLITGFLAAPHPSWTFGCGTLLLSKTIRMLDGQQSVIISYRANAICRLRIRLFISFRDYHSLTHRNSTLSPQVDERSGRLTLHPYSDLPPLTIEHNAEDFERDGIWYENHQYLRELDRGLEFQEDLYSPGSLSFRVTPNQEFFITATLGSTSSASAASITHTPQEVITDQLTRALDQFRVTRSDGKPTLIAGYPWFTDWSRDTLISLPALIAAGFEAAETRSILEFLLAERKQGILPNRFSDQGSTPEYNTVDASLWFFIAAQAYIDHTSDMAFVENTLLPAALDIIEWHTRGTFYGIHVDSNDSLLAAGAAGTQLTWMDAKIGDLVVTPRAGKPVEINALWFNALRIASHWAAQSGRQSIASGLLSQSVTVQNSFLEKFWNPSRECLYDVLTLTGPDASVRPNQLFAISLPYPLLDISKAKSVVRIAQQTLLTPVGLRTLEPSDPQYRPYFDGDMRSRDMAYHQGTVWPWLMGPFISAYLYAYDRSAEAHSYCQQISDSWLALTTSNCIGSIPEVLDGETPHLPGGCPAQLWSVAQLIIARHKLQA